jgi:3-deoxy-D-manno-octulosonate 8-phosphate phosphatase (KDO 8-P phosphatase)
MSAGEFAAAALQRGQAVRLVLLDVDGVLTDGGLYFSAQGETTKRFHTLDGHGLKLLQRAGIVVAIISGRDSPALRERMRALGIHHLHLGVHHKLPAAQALLSELGLNWSQTAAMGDDWPDLCLLTRAQLACAPSNAHAEVLARAHHVTQAPGGAGAVRELCDLLLTSTGHYARLLAEDIAGGAVLDTTASPAAEAQP